MNIQKGTVKWFSRDKGWGFVRLEDGSEIFVHHTDIEGDGRKTLEDDERIEFSIELLEKGPRARNVRRLDAQPSKTGRSRRGGRQRAASTEQASRPAKSTDQPASLAEQLRSRLTRLFPGIGT